MPSSVVGSAKDFSIYQIEVPGGEEALGLEIVSREWIEAAIRQAFPGFTSIVKVSSVATNSIAERVGFRVGDIFCEPCQGVRIPNVYHDLFSEQRAKAKDENWSLISNCEHIESSLQGNCTGTSKFVYVARKIKVEDSSLSSSLCSMGSWTLPRPLADKCSQIRSLTEIERQALVDDVKKHFRTQFERERDAIISKLPDKVRDCFGTIGIAKWNNSSYYLALCLNPFDIPTGEARQTWLRKYENLKAQGRLSSMYHLVYWYGSTDPATSCSIIPQSALLHIMKNDSMEGLPTELQRRLKVQKTAWDEIKEDFRRLPRSARFPPFLEWYDYINIQNIADRHLVVADKHDSAVLKHDLAGDQQSLNIHVSATCVQDRKSTFQHRDGDSYDTIKSNSEVLKQKRNGKRTNAICDENTRRTLRIRLRGRIQSQYSESSTRDLFHVRKTSIRSVVKMFWLTDSYSSIEKSLEHLVDLLHNSNEHEKDEIYGHGVAALIMESMRKYPEIPRIQELAATALGSMIRVIIKYDNRWTKELISEAISLLSASLEKNECNESYVLVAFDVFRTLIYEGAGDSLSMIKVVKAKLSAYGCHDQIQNLGKCIVKRWALQSKSARQCY